MSFMLPENEILRLYRRRRWKMEDNQIIELYWQRNEEAIKETQAKYGSYCGKIAENILNLLKTPKDTLPYAVTYLRTISVGFIPASFFGTISSVLRALGDSKTPLIFSIISCIINIILDLIIVIKFNLGIMGVGISTSISHFISAFLCCIYAKKSNSYFRLTIQDYIFSFDIFVKVVKVGIPMALQNSFIALSLIAIQRVINQFGSDYVTSFTIIGRINTFVHHPYLSLDCHPNQA